MLSENESTPPRLVKKRQPNAANRTARDAIKLVQDTNGRIAAWQLQLARHAANAERLTRRHEESVALRSALDAMCVEVAEERQRLEALIEEAPEEVRTNTRVHDSRRALSLVEARARTLVGVLCGEPEAKAGG